MSRRDTSPPALPGPVAPPTRVLLPTATAPKALPGLVPLPARGSNALDQMLQASTSWAVVPAPVSWTVTAVAWAMLMVDVLAVRLQGGPSLGWFTLATVVMVIVCVRTRGFRRANRAWFQIWTSALVLSVLTPVLTLVSGLWS